MKKVKLAGHHVMSYFGYHPKRYAFLSLLLFVLLPSVASAWAASGGEIRSRTLLVAHQAAIDSISRDTTPPEERLLPQQNLILTGTTHDISTREVVMGIQVELYKFLDEEKTELSYSGTFLNGQFKVPVSAMHHHLLVISRQGYEIRKILVKQGQIDFDDEELMMRRADTQEVIASAAFPLKDPVERSPASTAPAEEVQQQAVSVPAPQAATENESPPLLSRIEKPASTPQVAEQNEGHQLQPSIKQLPEEKASLPVSTEETTETKEMASEEAVAWQESTAEELPKVDTALIEEQEETNTQAEETTLPKQSTDAAAAEPSTVASEKLYSLTHNSSFWQGPVHTSKVIGYLKAGDQVEVVKKTGKWWWKVQVGDQIGYVRTEVLKQ